MYMVADLDVLHSFEKTEVPHPSEIEAPTTIEVIPQTTTEAPVIYDMDGIPLVMM